MMMGTVDSALVRETITANLTDAEHAQFMHVVERSGLDPLARQIMPMLREDRRGNRTLNILTTIDGLRVIAQRSGELDGQDGPFWCGPDGQWVDVWLDPHNAPAAAKVVVYRRGQTHGYTGVARFEAYAARKADGSLTPVWANMGDVMDAKCAEALALRKAFPNDMSGLYTGDEMEQAGHQLPDLAAPQVPKAQVQPVSRQQQIGSESLIAALAKEDAKLGRTDAQGNREFTPTGARSAKFLGVPLVVQAAPQPRGVVDEPPPPDDEDMPPDADHAPAPVVAPVVTAPKPRPAARPAPVTAAGKVTPGQYEEISALMKVLTAGLKGPALVAEMDRLTDVHAGCKRNELTIERAGYLIAGLKMEVSARVGGAK